MVRTGELFIEMNVAETTPHEASMNHFPAMANAMTAIARLRGVFDAWKEDIETGLSTYGLLERYIAGH